MSKRTRGGASASVTLNCSDPDGDALTYSKVTDPAHGALGAASGNSVTYTPANGYFGADSFTYKASDGTADSAPATVSLTVTHAPSCSNASAHTRTGNAVTVTLSCTDADGDPLTITATDPPKGSLGTITGGRVTYTPDAGSSGTDTFTFKANDGDGDSAAATATVKVSRAPTCSDVSRKTKVGTAVSVPLSCTDPDSGDTLTLSKASDPAHGTLGAVSGGAITYTPAAGYHGADSFTYKANDGDSDSAPATVSITVTQAPVCDAISKDATAGIALEITLSCTDPDAGDTLTYSKVTNPGKGSLGAVTGSKVTYTPNTSASGTDTFTYKASDGTADSAPATVTIDIQAVKVAPTVSLAVDNASAVEGSTLTFRRPRPTPTAARSTSTSSRSTARSCRPPRRRRCRDGSTLSATTRSW